MVRGDVFFCFIFFAPKKMMIMPLRFEEKILLLFNNRKSCETKKKLLLSSMEERDGGLGIVACAFDFDDFANAEAFVVNLLTHTHSWC